MPPLSLSDSELQAILAACKPLQPRDRDAFLRDVANEIAALPVRSTVRSRLPSAGTGTHRTWAHRGNTDERCVRRQPCTGCHSPDK
jgi:hypothetical protein